MNHSAEKDAPEECNFTHRDGCLSETTWDEDDCTCRPTCTICGQRVRPDGSCRWAPRTCILPPGR